jgi:hypothetical protein
MNETAIKDETYNFTEWSELSAKWAKNKPGEGTSVDASVVSS